jgi:hypothetical protein
MIEEMASVYPHELRPSFPQRPWEGRDAFTKVLVSASFLNWNANGPGRIWKNRGRPLPAGFGGDNRKPTMTLFGQKGSKS